MVDLYAVQFWHRATEYLHSVGKQGYSARRNPRTLFPLRQGLFTAPDV